MKKWEIIGKSKVKSQKFNVEDIVKILLENRGLTTKKDIERFLHPPDPSDLTAQDVGVDSAVLAKAVKRIGKAIQDKESIVVYADYDADGITAGAILWEALYALGARVMPYIPHRIEEGYGLSLKGIDAVREQFDPTLIITVDHGITAWEKVRYASGKGIEVIVTDHHVKPDKLPDCTIIHTTKLSGAGVSWFVAKELLAVQKKLNPESNQGLTFADFISGLLALAALGTIADLVPLVGPNRSIAKYGLAAINETARVGLLALLVDAGLTKGTLDVYAVSHLLAPRLNAMGRLEHAMDALRLLCTKQKDKAALLAEKLGMTNRDRQKITEETVLHARDVVKGQALVLEGLALSKVRKLLFVAHESYNPGVIGLVAGKLMEEYYLPAIVVSKGESISKASARSISGFNIVEAIRACSDILIDVGGHPMAAGFTVENKHLEALRIRLEQVAKKELTEDTLTRTLKIDAEIPLEFVTDELYRSLQQLQPFGFGNPEPVFATRGVIVKEARLVGATGKHLKLKVSPSIHPTHDAHATHPLDAIAFNQGNLYGQLQSDKPVDLAYTIDMNTWNGSSSLQLKVKDIRV
ncbi:single-stranded-DNA-specific exonuclease RecJ [Candidatus Gottesmanbacteria bacterium]|nr:single-stranded-DNA-specific exonuclease RecJ [Candidatus Gottesmanbacteria bacterium]